MSGPKTADFRLCGVTTIALASTELLLPEGHVIMMMITVIIVVAVVTTTIDTPVLPDSVVS